MCVIHSKKTIMLIMQSKVRFAAAQNTGSTQFSNCQGQNLWNFEISQSVAKAIIHENKVFKSKTYFNNQYLTYS